MKNIALATALLFFVCFISVVCNSRKVIESDYEMSFPFTDVYLRGDVEYIRPSFNSGNPYKISLPWWIKGFSNKLAPPIILLVVLITTDKLRAMWFMWFLYFSYICLDWVLFFEQWPWRYYVISGEKVPVPDILMCCTQVVWTGFYLYKKK